jgi:hypothetical protein
VVTEPTVVDADPHSRQGRNACKFAADLTLHAMPDTR